MVGADTAFYSADALASPGNVDDDYNQWEYSVPVGSHNVNHHAKSLPSRDSNSYRARFDKDRSSNFSQRSSQSRKASMQELNHAGSFRKRMDHIPSQNENETNGVHLDTYGADMESWSGNIRKSWDSHRLRSSVENDGTVLESMSSEPGGAHWIHRDKLARIESEELQQAAILFHRRGRGENKSVSSRGKNHEIENGGVNGSYDDALPPSEQVEPWPTLGDEQPEHDGPEISFGDEGGDEFGFDDRKDWNSERPLRSATQESFQDDNASRMYRNPGLRKSSSRIPIAAPSRLPVSAGRLGRDTPTQRGRTLTNGSDTGVSSSRPRRASEPLSLDFADNSANTSSTSTTGSRPGSRSTQGQPGKRPATKSNNTPANRKVSAPAGNRRPGSKPRTVSSNNASQSHSRPTTRSGENRTINRPEGDPPWLATMYKPDPRLPPEKQILPTHARRMQQEQWEKEGRTPVTYDREFAPLAITPNEEFPARKENKEEQTHNQEQAQQQKEKPGAEEQKENQASQPLPSPPQNPSQQQPPPSDGTTKTFRGPSSDTRPTSGYRTMPRLQDPHAATGSTRAHSPTPRTTTTIGVVQPDTGESEKKKKKEGGCGCCVVM